MSPKKFFGSQALWKNVYGSDFYKNELKKQLIFMIFLTLKSIFYRSKLYFWQGLARKKVVWFLSAWVFACIFPLFSTGFPRISGESCLQFCRFFTQKKHRQLTEAVRLRQTIYYLRTRPINKNHHSFSTQKFFHKKCNRKTSIKVGLTGCFLV